MAMDAKPKRSTVIWGAVLVGLWVGMLLVRLNVGDPAPVWAIATIMALWALVFIPTLAGLQINRPQTKSSLLVVGACLMAVMAGFTNAVMFGGASWASPSDAGTSLLWTAVLAVLAVIPVLRLPAQELAGPELAPDASRKAWIGARVGLVLMVVGLAAVFVFQVIDAKGTDMLTVVPLGTLVAATAVMGIGAIVAGRDARRELALFAIAAVICSAGAGWGIALSAAGIADGLAYGIVNAMFAAAAVLVFVARANRLRDRFDMEADAAGTGEEPTPSPA